MAVDDLRIGDFSNPVVRPPPEAAVAALEVEAKAAEAELKPMQSYEEQLREIGVNMADAAKIIDAILRKGFWSEEISITKSIKARLRTRNAKDRSRAVAYIETMRPMFDANYREMLNKQLLAASLELFSDDKFDHPDPRTAKAEDIERAFDNRFRYLDSVISDPAFNLLLHHFRRFDEKIRVVMQEGAVENF